MIVLNPRRSAINIKGVIFPESLLNALRDGRLVAFAGAGVSIGLPAGLPSFRKLAERAAEGTGQSIAGSELTIDSWDGYKTARIARVGRATSWLPQAAMLQ